MAEKKSLLACKTVAFSLFIAAFLIFAATFCGTAQAASISKTTLSMTAGQTYQLAVKGVSATPKWKSGKTSVAAVSASGTVSAKKAGSATVSAKVGGKTYKCAVTVLSKSAAQKKANALYKKKLAKSTIKICGKSYAASSIEFGLYDFNKDGVKDLIYGYQPSYTTSDKDAFVMGIYAFGGVKYYEFNSSNFFSKGYSVSKVTTESVVVPGYTNVASSFCESVVYGFDKNGKRIVLSTYSFVLTNDPTVPARYGSAYDRYQGLYVIDAMVNSAPTSFAGVLAEGDKYSASFSLTSYKNTAAARDAKLR